ncbi:MAG: 2'-5' RNA ligase family protein [Geminicoccaceae bacterium]
MMRVAALLMLTVGLTGTAFAQEEAASEEPVMQEYNVFAVPSREIEDLVSATAEAMADYGLETFYAQGFLPHVTLYLTAFPEDKLPEIKARIEAKARTMTRFPLQVDGTHLTKGRWYFLDLVRSEDLQRLSDEIVMELSPLRERAYEAPEWVQNYPEKLAAFERYGSPNVFTQFGPHLTQLAGEESTELDRYIEETADQPVKAEGEVIGIGFAPVDALGQVMGGTEEIYLFAN